MYHPLGDISAALRWRGTPAILADALTVKTLPQPKAVVVVVLVEAAIGSGVDLSGDPMPTYGPYPHLILSTAIVLILDKAVQYPNVVHQGVSLPNLAHVQGFTSP